MGFLKQTGQPDLKMERSGIRERPYFNKYSRQQYRKIPYTNSGLYPHDSMSIYTYNWVPTHMNRWINIYRHTPHIYRHTPHTYFHQNEKEIESF